MSDERDAADEAAAEGGDTEDSGSSGRTALVTKPAARPQRPSGKRSRRRAAEADEDAGDKESSTEASDDAGAAKEDSTRKASKAVKASGAKTVKKATKGKSGARLATPIVFVYNYLKQVVAEMRKVIWPNRKQMLTYTSVVLAFLAFMVALVGVADFSLTKLVMLVFG